MEYDNLLNLASELGRRLMECGAEIYRIEDSVMRLMQAYGAPDAHVFAIPSCLVVSLTPADGKSITRLCRVASHDTDLDRLEVYNALCRRLCSQTPPLEQALRELSDVPHSHPRYSAGWVLLGHVLISSFFTLFFGGSLFDALCSGVCGITIFLANRLLIPISGPNIFFRTLLAAAASALMAQLLVFTGLGHSVDTITAGALMILVPGISLTTAMREIMAGDMVSGLSHTAESLLVATFIALGTGAAMFLGGLL